MFYKSVNLTQILIEEFKLPVKSLHHSLKYFSCGCNNIILLSKSEIVSKNLIKKLAKFGVGAGQKNYNLDWLDKKYSGIIEDTSKLFSELIIINVTSLFTYKRLLIILLKSSFYK